MSYRKQHKLACVLAVDGSGDPDISGTPFVLTSKQPWFPAAFSSPQTITGIDGATMPYSGPVYDPAYIWYVYQIPNERDAMDQHVPIFSVVCTRSYSGGTPFVAGKLAVIFVSFWDNGTPTTDAKNLLESLQYQNKIAVLDPSVLTDNESLIAIA